MSAPGRNPAWSRKSLNPAGSPSLTGYHGVMTSRRNELPALALSSSGPADHRARVRSEVPSSRRLSRLPRPASARFPCPAETDQRNISSD